MRFVVRLAVREARASWRRLVVFFLCLAVGVGTTVALRSVIGSVRTAMAGESRAMLGADVRVQTNRAYDAASVGAIDEAIRVSGASRVSRELETLSMVRTADRARPASRLVELRGVQASFPLYGRLRLQHGVAYTHAVVAHRGLIARSDLLAQLGVGVGDTLLIGSQAFVVRGVIDEEPGRRLSAFSIAPRAYVDYADLQASGLVAYGSRATYRVGLIVRDAETDRVAADLRTRLGRQLASVRTYRSTEDNINRDLGRVEDFLSLIGLAMVVLGGLGVWSVVRVYVQQRLRSVAVLKCLGATGGQVLAAYAIQIGAMAIVGSLGGVVLAGLTLRATGPAIVALLPVPVAVGLAPWAAAQGIVVGCVVSLVFAASPLLEVLSVRPLMLLRAGGGSPTGPGRLRVAAAVVSIAAMLGLVTWQAGSPRIGIIFAAGFVALVGTLHLVGRIVLRLSTPLQRRGPFVWRYAARRMARQHRQTAAMLLTVGLATFLVVGVQLLQASLLREFDMGLRPETPDLFLIDVQPDQRAGVADTIRHWVPTGDPPPAFLPVLRARVVAVEGRNTSLKDYEAVRAQGELGREFTITYRAGLQRNERLVGGTFWTPSASTIPEVSIEESIQRRFRIDVGDRMVFDVMGRQFTARVTSVRRVNWTDAAAGGFVFVFRPGVFEKAPHAYVVPLRGPATTADRARLQQALAERFTNVSIIDVRDILSSLAGLLRTMTAAVTLVGLLVATSGGLILVGAVLMTKFERIQEVAVLKTLGAGPWSVVGVLATEYGLLGAVAGIVGGVAGNGLSWAVSRFAIQVAWRPDLLVTVWGIVASTVLVMTIGLVASLDIVRSRPLGALRAE